MPAVITFNSTGATVVKYDIGDDETIIVKDINDNLEISGVIEPRNLNFGSPAELKEIKTTRVVYKDVMHGHYVYTESGMVYLLHDIDQKTHEKLYNVERAIFIVKR